MKKVLQILTFPSPSTLGRSQSIRNMSAVDWKNIIPRTSTACNETSCFNHSATADKTKIGNASHLTQGHGCGTQSRWLFDGSTFIK